MRILLVDDEPEILVVLGRWLTSRGHDPVTTTDPMRVLDLIGTHDFGLICLDLMMPQINGMDLIPPIHQRKPELPIVVMTAVVDMRVAIHAMKEGAEDYLPKPIDFDKLDSIIKDVETRNEDHR